jgi:hypothetical protein
MGPNKITVLKKAVRLVIRHGPSLITERFYRRKEILYSPPVPCKAGAPLEIHMQVCNRDWLNALWTLKSLRHQCDEPFGLYLYLDFNVPSQVRPLLEAHFPGARLPRHDWLEQQVRERLVPVAPTLAALWRAHYSCTLYKMVNVWICAQTERIIYLDPDVLFFARPVELVSAVLEGGAANELGVFNATELPPAELEDPGAFCLREADLRRHYGINLPRDFNAGIGVLNLPKIDWRLLDQIFRDLPWIPDRTLLFDQTCLAILAAKCGWGRLNPARYLTDSAGFGTETVACHYFGGVRRDSFYSQGIPAMRRLGVLSRPHSIPDAYAGA